MPHQDQGRSAGAPAICAALDWLVGPQLFGRFSFRKDCSWTPQALAQAALVWAWGEEAALTDRYAAARQTIAQRAAGQRESVSYQAFMKLLKRHSALLLLALMEALQRRTREALAESYRMPATWRSASTARESTCREPSRTKGRSPRRAVARGCAAVVGAPPRRKRRRRASG